LSNIEQGVPVRNPLVGRPLRERRFLDVQAVWRLVVQQNEGSFLGTDIICIDDDADLMSGRPRRVYERKLKLANCQNK
jgi:hypothetical protein